LGSDGDEGIMKQTTTGPISQPQPAAQGHNGASPLDFNDPFGWPTEPAADAIRLDACARFDRLKVRTQRTVYDVVVLRGSTGEALVRGGRYFAQFRRARVVGSTLGGSTVRLGTIEVGARLELRLGRLPIVTSTIEAVSRVDRKRSRALVM
jgi:hypothetical protein